MKNEKIDFDQLRKELLLNSWVMFQLREHITISTTDVTYYKVLEEIANYLQIDKNTLNSFIRSGSKIKEKLNKSHYFIESNGDLPFRGYYIPVSTYTNQSDVIEAFKQIKNAQKNKGLRQLQNKLTSEKSRKESIQQKHKLWFLYVQKYITLECPEIDSIGKPKTIPFPFESACSSLIDIWFPEIKEVKRKAKVTSLKNTCYQIQTRYSIPALSDLPKLLALIPR